MNKHLYAMLLFAMPLIGRAQITRPDLEIAISSDHDTLKAQSYMVLTVKVWNRGTAMADRVVIDAPLARGTLVNGGWHQVSKGYYSIWGGLWDVGQLPANDSATLQLRVYVSDSISIKRFVQVQAQSPEDLDSQPNNNTSLSPVEDDEALLELPNTQKDCSNDATPPKLLYCPENVRVTTTDSLASAFWRTPLFSDNCVHPVALLGSHQSGDTFRLGTTLVTYTAKDKKENVSVCSFEVLVEKIEGTGVDLALTLVTAETSYKIYDYINYTLQVKNVGSNEAKQAIIEFKLPENTHFGGVNETDMGVYDLFFQHWRLDLKAGGTATLQLRVYTLNNQAAIQAFAKVIAANPGDKNASNNQASISIPAWTGASPKSSKEASVLVKNIYPNPSHTHINIDVVSKVTQPTYFAIYNAVGQQVMLLDKNIVKGVNKFQIDVIDYAPGIYFMIPLLESEQAIPVRFAKLD